MSESDYDDIIGLPHYEPVHHRRMPIESRAAQFAPFAALTGHGAAIAETARITHTRPELSEERQLELSRMLAQAIHRLSPVEFTYFQPDSRKAGGRFVDITGSVKKIDEIERTIILTDGRTIPIDWVVDIHDSTVDE